MLSISAAVERHPDSPNRQGDYGFIENFWCIYAASFNADFEALSMGPSESHAISGTFTFNGDGTGTATQNNLSVARGGGPTTFGGASSNTASFPFTYEVNGDGTWTLKTIGVTTGTWTSGPRTGETFTNPPAVPNLPGQISQNATTLTLANQMPRVQTVTLADGTVTHRICTDTRVFIALPNGR
jgi:hypothetical protein